jgi:hypothetical protein
MILPPIDEHLSDKLILLKVTKISMPMPTRTDENRRAFRKAIATELPHYLAHLLKMDIPLELRGDRFGVLTYQNPELLGRLNELSPEFQLLELIDTYLPFKEEKWRGLASSLQGDLEICAPSNQIRSLFSFSTACGVYLARLADKMPNRIEGTKSKGRTYYTITAPEDRKACPQGGNILSFPMRCQGRVEEGRVEPKS